MPPGFAIQEQSAACFSRPPAPEPDGGEAQAAQLVSAILQQRRLEGAVQVAREELLGGCALQPREEQAAIRELRNKSGSSWGDGSSLGEPWRAQQQPEAGNWV